MNTPRPSLRRVNREAVFAAANHTCAYCGAVNVALDINHIVPVALGGTSDPTNLEAVCRNCNFSLSRIPSELHFSSFLLELMNASARFGSVAREPDLSQIRPDIAATEKLSNGTTRELIIECKSLSVISGVRFGQTLRQLQQYRDVLPDVQIVLAFPGKAAPEILSKFLEAKIEIWDIDEIGRLFAKQIQQSEDRYYGPLFHRALARNRPEPQLIRDIKQCPLGLPGWGTYQKLIGRTLELLFCPPLNKPFAENSDFEKTNRRDFIFPNYASDGFWLAVRQRYGADYVLVDAKNSKGKISKTNVLQIANYLKPHGVGQFAIIIGRNGPDRAAEITIREQWLMHSKLIVILTDKELEAMLLARLAEGDPADVLSDKIQQFRLLI